TAVDIAAYRVVQESLTNVRKHAGPVSTRISLDYGASQLTLTVENAAAGLAPAVAGAPGEKGAHGAGHGIAGMREQASALGGGREAGATLRGGFKVTARLPLPEVKDATAFGARFEDTTFEAAAVAA